MSEFIKEINKDPLIYKQKKHSNILCYKNKNDTFYLFIKAFNSIDNFFIFLYSQILSKLNKITKKKIFNFHKIFFSTIIFTFFFTLVLNENINISTELLINAYFNDSQITHISYDKIIKKKFDEENKKQNSKNGYYYKNNKGRDCQSCSSYQNIQKNTKCCQDSNKIYGNKNNKNNENSQEETDYYMFNIFPIKCIFVTCFSFFSLYIIIKTTYYSRINNSIFINMVGVYTSFKILSYLYVIKYFLACGIIFVLFFYFFKCSIDSIYLILKYKRSDFEIFSTRLSAMNSRQFILKFIILFTGTFLSGLLSIFYFQFYFNYIVFYICLFTFIIFICNCIENELFSEHKYSKNVMIFFFGLINFTVNKITKNRYYLDKECKIEEKEIDDKAKIFNILDYLMLPINISNANSLYMISDIFTLFCFEYLDEYIEFKYKNFLDSKKKIKKIYSRHDVIFHCLFLISIVLSISGVLIKEYICFLLSLNISQKFNHYFSIIFNNNLSRVLNHIILLIYIITQYEISASGDEYLINLIQNTRLRKEIINIILKIFGISVLLYDIIYSNYLYYYSNTSHRTFYHYYSGFDIPETNNSECTDTNTEDSNYLNNNDSSISEDDENFDEDISEYKEEIKENFFEFASQLNTKKYKIKIIQSNNEDNKNIIFYLTNEIVLCYIDACIIIIFIIVYEQNILVKFIYGLIIIFLNTRKYFILNEIKNNGQYFFYYLISFFFAIRLIILTNNNSTILNYLAHINVYILLVYYCFINKRNYFLSIILILHLAIAHSNLKSHFILFDIGSVLVFLLIKNLKSKKKYKINKYDEQNNNLSLMFLLSLLTFFLIQLYGINKLFTLFTENFNKISNFFNEISLMTYGRNRDRKGQPIEYYIITDLINWIEK